LDTDGVHRRGGITMGWWRTNSGVIGDPPADYLDALDRTWNSPKEIPAEVRERLTALYVEGLGRTPTEDDLQDLLDYCR